jgi:hypothetical protein
MLAPPGFVGCESTPESAGGPVRGSLRNGWLQVADIASKKPVVDLGALGGVGIVLGTAGGWVVGLIAEALGKGPKLDRAMIYGPGAGAFFGVMLFVFDRIL